MLINFGHFGNLKLFFVVVFYSQTKAFKQPCV